MKKIYQIIALTIVMILAGFIAIKPVQASDEYPTVNIDIAPTKGMIQPGQEISIRASTEGFSLAGNDAEKMHFNWCLDSVILNSLIAGSSDEIVADSELKPGGPYHLENDYGNIHGPFEICDYENYIHPGIFGFRADNNVWERSIWEAFNIVPREYDVIRTLDAEDLENREDSDHDGLSDAWEMRYFSGRRIAVEEDGTETFIEYDTDKNVLLTQVKPEEDPDDDGWIYPYNDACYKDDDDDYHPSWCDGLDWGEYGRPETLRIPKISTDSVGNDNAIGDGKWTNWEEFVAGTDPLNPDTDGDGIMDEQDWAGGQQDLFTMRVMKDWGDKYDVHVNAFGIDQRYKDDNVKKDRKYYRAMYPSYYDPSGEQNITPEGENILSVGTGLAFESAMGYSPAPPQSGDEVLVRAETTKIGETRGLDLVFRWFLDQKEFISEDGDGELEEGLGKKSFSFTTNRNPCEKHKVGLEVMEMKTRKINYNEIDILMGFKTSLQKTILGNADFSKEGARDYNQRVGTEQGWEELKSDNADPLLAQVSPEIGYRKGDIVKVEINGITEGWSEKCGESSYEEYMGNLNYRWNFTRKEQETKSGKGNNYKSAIFIVSEEPRIQEGATGDRAETLTEQSNEYVGAEVSDSNGTVVAREKESMKTIAPTINFEVSGAEQGTSAEDSSKPVFQAEPWSEVTIAANLSYFRPSKGFDYVWKRNNEIVSEMRGTNVTESSYTFQAGVGLDRKSSGSSQDVITLEVVNTISGSGNTAVKENSEQTATIEIISEAPGGVDAISGALKNFIPAYYRNVFNLSMAAAATCLVVIMALGFTSGTVGSRKK